MGSLMRTPNGEFAEYHTSGDDLQFIKPEALEDSFEKCLRVLEIFENDDSFVNLYPFGEPRLGHHGLYESLPADANREQLQQAIQWVLNFSDGEHSLFDIAVRSRMDFSSILGAARQLAGCGLIASQD
jgi:aminopeptidase-like protein